VKLAESVPLSQQPFHSSHSEAVKQLHIALRKAHRAIDAALLRASVTDQHQQLSATHQPAPRAVLQDVASAQVPVSRAAANRTGYDSRDVAEQEPIGLPAAADIASLVDRYTRTLSDKIYQLVSEKMTTSLDESAFASAAEDKLCNSSECNTKL